MRKTNIYKFCELVFERRKNEKNKNNKKRYKKSDINDNK